MTQKPTKEQKEQQEQQAAFQQQQQTTPFGQPMPSAPPAGPGGPSPMDPAAVEKMMKQLNQELDTWKTKHNTIEKSLAEAETRAREAESSKKLHMEAAKLREDNMKHHGELSKIRATMPGAAFSPLLSDKLTRIESKVGKLRNMHGTLKTASTIPKLQWGQKNAQGFSDPRSHPEWETAKNYGWENDLKGTPDKWQMPTVADNDPNAPQMKKLRQTFMDEKLNYQASPASTNRATAFRDDMVDSTKNIVPGSTLGNKWYDTMYPGNQDNRKLPDINSLSDVVTRAKYAPVAATAAIGDFISSGAQSVIRNGSRLVGNTVGAVGNVMDDYKAQKSDAQYKGEAFDPITYKFDSENPNQYQENWRAYAANAGQNAKDTGVGALEQMSWGTGSAGLKSLAGLLGAHALIPGISENGMFTENQPVNYEAIRSRLNLGQPQPMAPAALGAAGYTGVPHTAFNNPVLNDTYAPNTYMVRDAQGNVSYESRPNFSGHFSPEGAPDGSVTPAGDDTAYNAVSSLGGMFGLTRPDHQAVFGGHQLMEPGGAPPQFAPPGPGGLQQLLMMYGPGVVQQILRSGVGPEQLATYDQSTQG